MDDAEFSAIVERYTDYAYNIAYRLLNNAADAEDAVQDAFLSAYRSRERFRGDARVTTWLYRIVVNAALQKVRKERKPQQTSAADIEDVVVVDRGPGPESHAINAELGERLGAALALLPNDLRTAVVLRDVEQLSSEEAAEVVGVSVAAFKARLHRGRVALREELGPYLAQREQA
ncbi:MAG: sigma-70 family RNA polymerase sigma factor [Chloroflexota bacterium]